MPKVREDEKGLFVKANGCIIRPPKKILIRLGSNPFEYFEKSNYKVGDTVRKSTVGQYIRMGKKYSKDYISEEWKVVRYYILDNKIKRDEKGLFIINHNDTYRPLNPLYSADYSNITSMNPYGYKKIDKTSFQNGDLISVTISVHQLPLPTSISVITLYPINIDGYVVYKYYEYWQLINK